MLHHKKLQIFFFILAVGVIGVFFFLQKQQPLPQPQLTGSDVKAEEIDRVVTVKVQNGDTFSSILSAHEISYTTINEILEASAGVYDFTKIRVGKPLSLAFDKTTGELIGLIYEIDSEEQAVVAHANDTWAVKRQPIEYEIRTKKVEGVIESSLYEAALAQGIDERAIISLAEIFAWQIDFAIDIRVNDTFTMIYEERYVNNEYAMPGEILAAKFNNSGTEYRGYTYVLPDGETGYYDPEGNSLQKMFLKSPLQYKYISSAYGVRIDPISHRTSMHTGIDYAAPHGTPAVTVGDGTVVAAGWNGGYGNAVDVRHNERYTTRYGHFSRIAVKVGQKVSQGDIVGYVGSTGWSTGPHLHFEIITNGKQVNPLKVEIPPSEGLAPELLPEFQEYIQQFEL